MEQASWYAVYTASRAEKRVQERLNEANIVNYLPLRVVERKWNNRVKRVNVPLISGCVFVYISKSDFLTVESILGVVAFLKESSIPAVIPDKQIQYLRIINDHAEELDVVDMDIPIGTLVCVVQGQLTGLVGELIESVGKHRILVRIQHLGCVLMTIAGRDVELVVE